MEKSHGGLERTGIARRRGATYGEEGPPIRGSELFEMWGDMWDQ